MTRLLNKFSGFIAGMGSTLVLFPAMPSRLPEPDIGRHFERIGADFRKVFAEQAVEQGIDMPAVKTEKDQLWLPGIK